MVLCGESDADSTLLAISQLATHHYALCEMWRAGSGYSLKPAAAGGLAGFDLFLSKGSNAHTIVRLRDTSASATLGGKKK